MAKRIQVWPPGGGDPIKIYEADASRLVNNGWTTEPVSKPKAKSKDRAATKAETEAN
jgi:hypothetical protein